MLSEEVRWDADQSSVDNAVRDSILRICCAEKSVRHLKPKPEQTDPLSNEQWLKFRMHIDSLPDAPGTMLSMQELRAFVLMDIVPENDVPELCLMGGFGRRSEQDHQAASLAARSDNEAIPTDLSGLIRKMFPGVMGVRLMGSHLPAVNQRGERYWRACSEKHVDFVRDAQIQAEPDNELLAKLCFAYLDRIGVAHVMAEPHEDDFLCTAERNPALRYCWQNWPLFASRLPTYDSLRRLMRSRLGDRWTDSILYQKLLPHAVSRGDALWVTRLLDSGYVNVNTRISHAESRSALALAAKLGQLDTIRQLLQYRPEISADDLDIEQRGPGQMAPLHEAIHHGQLACALQLLHHDASWQVREGHGWTSLHLLMKTMSPRTTLRARLPRRGALGEAWEDLAMDIVDEMVKQGLASRHLTPQVSQMARDAGNLALLSYTEFCLHLAAGRSQRKNFLAKLPPTPSLSRSGSRTSSREVPAAASEPSTPPAGSPRLSMFFSSHQGHAKHGKDSRSTVIGGGGDGCAGDGAAGLEAEGTTHGSQRSSRDMVARLKESCKELDKWCRSAIHTATGHGHLSNGMRSPQKELADGMFPAW